MELKIANKKENPLLSRIEVSGEIVFSGATPSNADLQKAIADKLKVDPSVVKVKNINTSFGETKASFEVNVYQSKELLDNFEPIGKKVKEKIAKAEEEAKKKAEEAKAAEAPKEEAPKEEKPSE